jgi:hypothetical protein
VILPWQPAFQRNLRNRDGELNAIDCKADVPVALVIVYLRREEKLRIVRAKNDALKL